MVPVARRFATLPEGLLLKFAVLACVLLSVLRPADATATMVLVSNTTLVSGSETSLFTFTAPGPGTVTALLSNLAWPQPLADLSFTASTASQVLAAWNAATSQSESFQVTAGTYFAHVSATAAGPLDLGLYSISVSFTPAAAPVPLPQGWALLAAGILVLLGFFRMPRSAALLSFPRAAP